MSPNPTTSTASPQESCGAQVSPREAWHLDLVLQRTSLCHQDSL